MLQKSKLKSTNIVAFLHLNLVIDHDIIKTDWM